MATKKEKTWMSIALTSGLAFVITLVALFTKGGDPEAEKQAAIEAGLQLGTDVVDVITQPKDDEEIVEEIVEPEPPAAE